MPNLDEWVKKKKCMTHGLAINSPFKIWKVNRSQCSSTVFSTLQNGRRSTFFPDSVCLSNNALRRHLRGKRKRRKSPSQCKYSHLEEFISQTESINCFTDKNIKLIRVDNIKLITVWLSSWVFNSFFVCLSTQLLMELQSFMIHKMSKVRAEMLWILHSYEIYT